MKRCVLSSLVWLVAGCGDDGAPPLKDTDGDESSSGSGTGSGPTSQPPETGTGDPDESSDATSGAPVEVSWNVVTYAEQPMVVDVHLELSVSASVTLTHATDAGVLIEALSDEPGTELSFRVRGLLPDTDHALDYAAVSNDSEADAQGTIDFATEEALIGFVPAFTIEATAVDPAPGYRMFDIMKFPEFDASGVFAVDSAGFTRWYLGGVNTDPAIDGIWAAAKLRDDGTFVVCHGQRIQIIDELGEISTDLSIDDVGVEGFHHDILELPNGNFMALTYTFRDVTYTDLGEVLVAGDGIAEFTSDGDLVWLWDSFDHLDPQRRTEFEQIVGQPSTGEFAYDWTHANGIVWEEDTDSVLISLRHQDWIMRVDRTTDAVVWRLGFEGDFTLDSGEWFYHQHSPQWQPDGSLLLYDNANGNPGLAPEDVESRAVRFEIDETDMTATIAWEDDEDPFMSPVAGDADLLPGGHYQITDSLIQVAGGGVQSRIRELDPEADPMRVWTLSPPPGIMIYRSTFTDDRFVGLEE